MFPALEVSREVQEVDYTEVGSCCDPQAQSLELSREKLLHSLSGQAGGTSQHCKAIVPVQANVFLWKLCRRNAASANVSTSSQISAPSRHSIVTSSNPAFFFTQSLVESNKSGFREWRITSFSSAEMLVISLAKQLL